MHITSMVVYTPLHGEAASHRSDAKGREKKLK